MALEGGLLTESEVSGLLYLIREPDVCAYGDFKFLLC